MLTVSFTQLRQNAKNYFDAVERGDKILVERHGKVIAQIHPVSSRKQIPWKSKGLQLIIPGVSLSEMILKERAESR